MSYVGIRCAIAPLSQTIRSDCNRPDPTRPDAINLSKVKKTGDLQSQNSNGGTSSPHGAHAVCPTKQVEPIKSCNF